MIVAADRRGEGVGARLMDAVVDHPTLDDVNPVLTCRRGPVDFYERFGFDPYPAVEVPGGDDEALHHLVRTAGDEE